jgi:hypothetical protein
MPNELEKLSEMLKLIQSEFLFLKQRHDTVTGSYIGALKRVKDVTPREELIIASPNEEYSNSFNVNAFFNDADKKFRKVVSVVYELEKENKKLHRRLGELTDTLLRELNHERDY